MRHVHRSVVCLGLIVGVLGCGSSGGTDPGTTPPPGAVPEVFTPGQVFSPPVLTVAAGDSVRFNISSSHNVVFNKATAGAPADIPIVTNTVVVRRFTAKGTFAYDCTVHPGMTGQVVVK